jgi:hypothetical protein
MAGLVPAIYLFLLLKRRKLDVDGRDKRGHDDVGRLRRKSFPQASWPDLFRPSTSFFADAP